MNNFILQQNAYFSQPLKNLAKHEDELMVYAEENEERDNRLKNNIEIWINTCSKKVIQAHPRDDKKAYDFKKRKIIWL